MSFDAMATSANAIAKVAGLWQKVAGLRGALYLSPFPSLFLTTHSHALTHVS